MFSFIKKYLCTSNTFILLKNKLYFVFEDTLFESDISKLKINEKIIQINYYYNKFFIEIISEPDGFERTLILDESTMELVKEYPIYDSVIRGSLENYLGIYKKSVLNIYDVKNKKEIRVDIHRPFLFKIVTREFLAHYSKEILYFKNFITEIIKWEFAISHFAPSQDDIGNFIPSEIENIIGVYDNKLWLHISYQKIVALDIENGNLVHQIQLNDHLSLPFNSNDGLYVGDLHLDEINGIIKSLSDRYYFELDLKNLQAVIKKDFGKDHSNNWRIKRSRFYEGDKNLYFIGANKGEAVNRAVGIFDTESCEVIWYDTPLEEKKFLFYTDTPQRNDSHLAVLDSENNLWLYEKENKKQPI